MNRRNFLKASALSSVAIGLGSPLSLKGHPIMDTQSQFDFNVIDPVVPFRFYIKEADKMFSQMIEMKDKYGIRKFLLTAPMDEIKLLGYPSNKVYQEIGNQVLFVKENLKKHDIQVGWWCAPSLRSGPNGPFQYITDLSGAVADSTPCPLDPKFKEDFSTNIATVVEIAKPFRVQIEDDYELSWQPPHVNFGCFCPLHMAEFSKRQSKEYSREQLLEIFKSVTPESIQLREAWAVLSRDTLVDFAKAVRTEVDKIAPSTSICLCQSDQSDLEGDSTKDVAIAFAGNTRPSVRIAGASYAVDNLLDVPIFLFHALYSKQHLPQNFEFLHETDSYPHTRYFTSSNTMKSLLTCIYSYGFDDTLFYATQYLDNPLEERGYVEMFNKERLKFETLKKEIKHCELVGCEIPFKPSSHIYRPYVGRQPTPFRSAWIGISARFGIPYTTKSDSANVKLISGKMIDAMTDQEINTILKGGAFLDGVAAECLCNRGFGDLIGIEKIIRGGEANFVSECIRKTENFALVEGRLMYNFIFAPSGDESGEFFRISPKFDAEIITDFLDTNQTPVIPGMITYENELGGRVATMAFDLGRTSSSTLYNYKKKELVRETINWLGKKEIPVCVVNQPNVFCIFNQSTDGNYGIVTINNMTADIYESVSLMVSKEWIKTKVEVLDTNGTWQRCITKEEQLKTVNVVQETLSPIILKLTKI